MPPLRELSGPCLVASPAIWNSCSNYLCGFDARHVGSGVWWIWDGGEMSWRATDLAEDDARQQAADLNVTFNPHGQRDQADRREVSRSGTAA